LKVGDLVRSIAHGILTQSGRVGVVIEVIDHVEVPPVVKVLWAGGEIDKDWTDELEIVNESG
tara:strand:- start:949 stop:1134 length:186 start_codon:yes stop_codon:yes gene_type:complete